MKEYLLNPDLEAKLENDRADSIKELRDGGAKYTSEGNAYGNRSRLEVTPDQILEAKKLMRFDELEKEKRSASFMKAYKELPGEKQRACHLLKSIMTLSEVAKKMEENSDARNDIENEIGQMKLDAQFMVLDFERANPANLSGYDANVVGGATGRTQLEMRRIGNIAEKMRLYDSAEEVLKNKKKLESFKNSDVYEKLQDLIGLQLSPDEQSEEDKIADVREKIAANG